jgi:hypothetical protein
VQEVYDEKISINGYIAKTNVPWGMMVVGISIRLIKQD